VVVWGENRHEQIDPHVRDLYPDGMHTTIADGLRTVLGAQDDVTTHTLDEPQNGLREDVLTSTDVLVWWGHLAHEEVDDDVVDRVHRQVNEGMGILVLHSGHHSKIFKRLMGTTCSLRWRNAADRELVWTTNPRHPIAAGVPQPIIVSNDEMYGEYFDIPEPDELVFISSYTGGEVFRSGITYRRGFGRVFYFSPGDQDYPVYHHPDIQRVLANGVTWANPDNPRESYSETLMYRPNEFGQGWLATPDGLVHPTTGEPAPDSDS
jgi:trehalose utilization protein